MVRKREQVFAKKNVEAGPRSLHLRFRIGEPPRRVHDVGETPTHFRVAARNCRDQQRFERPRLGRHLE